MGNVNAVTRVTKIFSFSAAHKLENHEGKCANLHGHNYKVELTIEGPKIKDFESLSSEDMVIDFKHIKDIIVKRIKDEMDHKYLNDIMDVRTTSENIAEFIFNYADRCLCELKYSPTSDDILVPEDTHVHCVKLWESDTSYTEYTRV